MKTVTRSIVVMVLLSVFFIGLTAVHAGNEGVKTGKLVVKAVPGTGHNLIIKSSVDIEAVFTDADGKEEYYIGEMGYKLGVDLSFKSHEELAYLVFSPSSNYKTGSYALQGKYFGQKATATMGVGTGVQVLLGGSGDSFTLQPLALAGTKGIGVSAGLGYLYLQKDYRR